MTPGVPGIVPTIQQRTVQGPGRYTGTGTRISQQLATWVSTPYFSTYQLCLGDKRDTSGVRAASTIEFGPLGYCVGLSTIFFESGGVGEKKGDGVR